MSYEVTLCAMNLLQVGFDERVRVASAAGFDSIGLSLAQYRQAQDDGFTDAAMRALLADTGLRLAEIEGPWDWLSGDASSLEDTATILHAARALGCSHITAVQFVPADVDHRVRALSRLCDAAAEFGARVGLEFMPFSNVPTLSDAWGIVQATARDNCGLVLDNWHFQRTNGWEEPLALIPHERLYAIQLCDAAAEAEPDAREEARHRRLLPGEQSVAILRRLEDIGFAGRLSTEVWSDELFRADPRDAADRLFSATVTALRAANWP
ncbi:sugar phosphate isomerase/epimerase family protein [Lacisediminihabitans profunda]|uniref:Sugar phosphate isomerase/epimerase n=1 Tax=Lacisediminihabitans profunda TaxID=2594790 RepID=A0A5C8UKK9_9MICO|nr:sugar phosphate isomerase/epimerase family protein [Lacisediminihabitans profunda]TXN28357.1 sugar phosphate isomerase/epimerase [Lacisediminihabitans profunda]